MLNYIPKIIHYCWFGPNHISLQSKKFIRGWHLKNPSFKIIKWSENNFDVNRYLFTKKAYLDKNWAAISDYVRLIVLQKYGGIYLDTDVEDLKSLTPLLENNSFIGMENVGVIASGLIFGCKPNDYNVNKILKIYDDIGKNDDFDRYANDQVYISTMYFTKYGFKRKNKVQVLNNCTIYPTSYFCPQRRGHKKIKIYPSTYTFHHYYGSWLSNNKMTWKKRTNILIGNGLTRIFGISFTRKFRNLYLKMMNFL